MRKAFALVALALLLAPAAFALNETAVGEIENKVWDIYSLIQILATVCGTIAIAYGGLSFMISGNDPMKRNQSKQIIMGAIVGLVVIWVAPYVARALMG